MTASSVHDDAVMALAYLYKSNAPLVGANDVAAPAAATGPVPAAAFAVCL